MALDMVTDIIGLADETRPSKLWYLLGYSIFGNEPYIVAWHHCLHLFIVIGSDIDGGGRIDIFSADVEVEIVFALNARFG